MRKYFTYYKYGVYLLLLLQFVGVYMNMEELEKTLPKESD